MLWLFLARERNDTMKNGLESRASWRAVLGAMCPHSQLASQQERNVVVGDTAGSGNDEVVVGIGVGGGYTMIVVWHYAI